MDLSINNNIKKHQEKMILLFDQPPRCQSPSRLSKWFTRSIEAFTELCLIRNDPKAHDGSHRSGSSINKAFGFLSNLFEDSPYDTNPFRDCRDAAINLQGPNQAVKDFQRGFKPAFPHLSSLKKIATDQLGKSQVYLHLEAKARKTLIRDRYLKSTQLEKKENQFYYNEIKSIIRRKENIKIDKISESSEDEIGQTAKKTQLIRNDRKRYKIEDKVGQKRSQDLHQKCVIMNQQFNMVRKQNEKQTWAQKHLLQIEKQIREIQKNTTKRSLNFEKLTFQEGASDKILAQALGEVNNRVQIAQNPKNGIGYTEHKGHVQSQIGLKSQPQITNNAKPNLQLLNEKAKDEKQGQKPVSINPFLVKTNLQLDLSKVIQGKTSFTSLTPTANSQAQPSGAETLQSSSNNANHEPKSMINQEAHHQANQQPYSYSQNQPFRFASTYTFSSSQPTRHISQNNPSIQSTEQPSWMTGFNTQQNTMNVSKEQNIHAISIFMGPEEQPGLFQQPEPERRNQRHRTAKKGRHNQRIS